MWYVLAMSQHAGGRHEDAMESISRGEALAQRLIAAGMRPQHDSLLSDLKDLKVDPPPSRCEHLNSLVGRLLLGCVVIKKL